MLPTNTPGVKPSPKFRGFSLSAPHLTAVQSPIKGIEATLDAFTCILEFTSLPELQKLVDDLFSVYQDKIVWYPDLPYFSGIPWQGHATSPTGILVTFNMPTEDAPGKCRIDWKGKTIRRAPLQASLWLIKRLKREYGARFTRVDLTLDDYDKSLKEEEIREALAEGNYKGWRYWDDFRSRRSSGLSFNFRLGTRNADSCLRMYDKEVESKGDIKSIRVERECKDKYSDEIIEALIYTYDNCNGNKKTSENWIAKVIGSLALGNARFVEVKRDEKGKVLNRNADREKPLDWWKAFTDKIGEGVRIRKKSVKPTLQKTEEWHEKSVSTSLAKAVLVHGKEYLEALLESGMKKLLNPNNPAHRFNMAQVEVARNELKLATC